MGLINRNYKIGHNVYDTVYAVFNGNIKRSGDAHIVYFNIDTTREFALTDEPLKTVGVVVENWDRKCNIVELAYQQGKKPRKDWTEGKDGKPIEVFCDNVFTGWVDDVR